MKCSRCENCQGKGKVLGLGCMLKECTSCAGVGYVSQEPVPKKRTRRPRVDNPFSAAITSENNSGVVEKEF